MTTILTNRTFPPAFPPPFANGGWGENRFGLFADLEFKGVVQRMRWIPPGEFVTGSDGGFTHEKPPHKVALTRGFWLADTPCTQELWEAVMGENPSHFKKDGAKRPLERVSWNDCQEFLERLGAGFERLKFVLPSEAQWEYACRAGSQAAWCFGDDEAVLKDYAWYRENSGSETHPVGVLKRNGWGLADMHGNVWEWCADYWKDDYVGAGSVDPTGPPRGDYRVIRGGSWSYSARGCRSAYRNRIGPDFRFNYVGFRFAQVGGAE